ncbi:MAG: hypothetical protein ACLQGP_36535 [Isosphaeraceae bacterium]
MTRLELPLQGRTLKATGDLVLHAELNLVIKTNQGFWRPAVFRIDSGTEMTTMLAARAKAWDLPIPKRLIPGLTLHGQEV